MKMNGKNVTAGRCYDCPTRPGRGRGTVYYWPSSVARLAEMRCPVHGTRLGQTSLGQWAGREVELSAEEVRRVMVPGPDTAAELRSIRTALKSAGFYVPKSTETLPAQTLPGARGATIAGRSAYGVRAIRIFETVRDPYDENEVVWTPAVNADLVAIAKESLRAVGWTIEDQRFTSIAHLFYVRPTPLSLNREGMI